MTYDFDDEPDDDGTLDLPEPDDSPVAGPADPLFGGINVAALAAELIGPAVQKAVAKKLDELATEAVSEALSADVLDQLRAEADEAAESVLHGSTGAAGDETPPLYYGSTNEFFREHLRHIYKRKIDGTHTFWSPRWWTSAEAIARLEALWRAWEHLRLDPSTGPSVWWRDHADPHMSMLMSSIGPFSKEINEKATVLQPLPHEEPPEGLFPDVREVLP